MTDNEKAATFIGWKPFIDGSCENCHCLMSGHHPNGCEGAGGTCGCGLYYGMNVRAPDMTRPENYMRALENLPSNLMWNIGRGPRGGRFCNILGAMYGVADPRGQGATPLIALAALYDTQH